MGWTFKTTRGTKAEIKNEILASLGAYSILHRTVGNHLWVAVRPLGEVEEGCVLLFLLKSSRGCWGYKDMDEGMGPYYYDCPESVIAAAGPTTKPLALAWRAKVREYHAEKKLRKGIADGVKVGDVVTLKNAAVKEFRITAIVGKKLYGVPADGGTTTYRIPRSWILRTHRDLGVCALDPSAY